MFRFSALFKSFFRICVRNECVWDESGGAVPVMYERGEEGHGAQTWILVPDILPLGPPSPDLSARAIIISPAGWGGEEEQRKLADVCSENYFICCRGNSSNEASNRINKVEVMHVGVQRSCSQEEGNISVQLDFCCSLLAFDSN